MSRGTLAAIGIAVIGVLIASDNDATGSWVVVGSIALALLAGQLIDGLERPPSRAEVRRRAD